MGKVQFSYSIGKQVIFKKEAMFWNKSETSQNKSSNLDQMCN